MLDVWKHVCSGTSKFKKYKSSSHERRFLQALHSRKTHEFLATTISAATGRDVTLGSAWIDGNPRFNWTLGQDHTTGEIADLLVIVDRTDQKDKVTQLACMVQTKVSDRSDSIEPTTPSTDKQLALYREWPAVSFDDECDIAALAGKNGFALNPDKKTWPFRFLQIGLIASPVPGKDGPPRWLVKSASGSPNAEEPFAMLSMPTAQPKTLVNWLLNEIPKPLPTEFQSIGLQVSPGSKNAEFERLVAEMLRVLAVRQAVGKKSNSGGQLVRFGGVQFRVNKIAKFQRGSGAAGPRAPDGTADADEVVDEKPFLILYIKLGPEGGTALRPPPPRARPEYPGASLLP